MAEIERIVIKSSTGYCCSDEAFKDKISITSMYIVYEYIPYLETEINPKRKWSYRTDSPIFKKVYSDIADMIPEILGREITEVYDDIGWIEFNITYIDKTRFKATYWVSGDYFEVLFKTIKRLIPECEYIPAVFLTSEDYKDNDEKK